MKKIIIAILLIFLAIIIFSLARQEQTSSPASPTETNPVPVRRADLSENSTNQRGSVKINAGKSKVQWNAKRVVGSSNHNGMVNLMGGFFVFDSGKISGGEFVIDMDTITNEDIQNQSARENFVSHLKGDNFFDVEKFPESTFAITGVEEKASGENTHEITGNLTIKEVTNEIAFPAKVSTADGKIMADALLSIDRTRWDIKFGSNSFFDNLGDQAIDDIINFQIHLET